MPKYALVTGASSGIGRDMARELSRRGYALILVARRRDRLEELQCTLPAPVTILPMDLSKEENCRKLHASLQGKPIDILINNAGFGVFGPFAESSLDKELEMLDTNIRAVHILTKLFLQDFLKRNHGYILNTSSSAAFLPGPLLAGYYASKAYVLRLTEAIHEEIRRKNSRVYIGALCPGPVKTEFDRVAGVHFSMKGQDSGDVARYAICRMFQRQMVIIPGISMKAGKQLVRLLPEQLLLRVAYHLQSRKARRY